jgi:hypothetical protein
LVQLADAEWDFDDAKAETLRIELQRIETSIAKGEVWFVPF